MSAHRVIFCIVDEFTIFSSNQTANQLVSLDFNVLDSLNTKLDRPVCHAYMHYQHCIYNDIPYCIYMYMWLLIVGGGEGVQVRGDWSRFLWNAHLIITHHMQCMVFADSAG